MTFISILIPLMMSAFHSFRIIDPEGFLLYDSISDFDQDKVYYNIFYSTTTTTEQKAVVVVFWHLEEDAKSVTDPGKDYFATVSF